MALARFVEERKRDIVERWTHGVADRLGLQASDRPLLINELPEFLDELVCCLGAPPAEWRRPQSARLHGRQRLKLGVDIGALAEEFGLIGETILELARKAGVMPTPDEQVLLMRLISRGIGDSVLEYASLRDREVATQAARHFSFCAHEIRNPLNSARLSVRLLEQQPDQPAHLQRVQRSLTKVAELVDGSLLHARLYGEPHVDREPISAVALTNRALDEVEFLAERRRISLERQVEDFTLEVDCRLIASALSNLLINALKFSPEGSLVTVQVECSDDRAHFKVEDQCGGMPEDLPPRLFQPFVQRAEDRSGFGLGLMIVKQAVEAHGGSVRAMNNPGRGCCFVIDLPLGPTEA